MRQTNEFAYVHKDRIATAADKARAHVGRLAHSRSLHVAVADRMGLPEVVHIMAGPIDFKAKPVAAYINHGRWIASCECGGAEVVDPADPFFMCMSCFNSRHGRALRPTVFPTNQRAIQGVLIARDDPRHRNWDVDDTIDKLKKQNREHGEREEV